MTKTNRFSVFRLVSYCILFRLSLKHWLIAGATVFEIRNPLDDGYLMTEELAMRDSFVSSHSLHPPFGANDTIFFLNSAV